MALGLALSLGQRPQLPWSTGQLLALARASCTECLGTGGEAEGSACVCVWEQIFLDCYRRYRACQQSQPRGYIRNDQEYVADFEQVAKRALSPPDRKIFRHHFELGGCFPRDQRSSEIMHRIMRTAGRVFRETQPYPLWPPHSYFGEPVHLAPKNLGRQ